MIGNAVGFIWLRWDILIFMYENANFRSEFPTNRATPLVPSFESSTNAENNDHPEADSSGFQMDVNSHFQADATRDNEVLWFVYSEWVKRV